MFPVRLPHRGRGRCATGKETHPGPPGNAGDEGRRSRRGARKTTDGRRGNSIGHHGYSFNQRPHHWELRMATRRSRTSASIAVKSVELALAIPQVIAQRVARMALAGPNPSARDRREFQAMVSEKPAAFAQAWTAMATESCRANQAIATSLFAAFFNPFSRHALSGAATVGNAAIGVLDKGLAPVHRQAVANARRLARTTRRAMVQRPRS
jgi:hypothetical protein